MCTYAHKSRHKKLRGVKKEKVGKRGGGGRGHNRFTYYYGSLTPETSSMSLTQETYPSPAIHIINEEVSLVLRKFST